MFISSNETVPVESLLSTERVDIAVIGGGYSGVSTALHCADYGLDVCLIEKETIGWGASGRNGGQVIPGLKELPETIFSSFGLEMGKKIVNLAGNAPDYVFKLIRENGGICIADEVQIGFGRMGSHYWGFETENVIPDIITVGKSMGNGHPISAVVTTREIADRFNNGMEYFNSFGGNPVSCAVGRSVLKVIEKEKLQENAHKTGSFLIKLLKNLKKEHAIIGDVRGRGLFIGIELIRDKTTKEPADVESKQLVNRIKDKGVLLSVDGPFNNVIKLKPPLVFNKENAKFLVNKLGQTLEEIKQQT